MGRVKQWTGILLIVAAVSGTLLDKSSRPGFFISLMFVGIISIRLDIHATTLEKEKQKERL